VTKTAKGCHGLVVFLWALSNGMGWSVNLFDPRGSSQMDAKGQQVMLEIFQGKQSSSTLAPNVDQNARQTETPDRLSNAPIKHIKAMTDSTLKSIEREDLKKSMLSPGSLEKQRTYSSSFPQKTGTTIDLASTPPPNNS
jgi:hypothetical protein